VASRRFRLVPRCAHRVPHFPALRTPKTPAGKGGLRSHPPLESVVDGDRLAPRRPRSGGHHSLPHRAKHL